MTATATVDRDRRRGRLASLRSPPAAVVACYHLEMGDAVWVRRCSSFEEEEQADLEFWARMTPAERLAAAEELRLGEAGEFFERLQRVVRILPLEEG